MNLANLPKLGESVPARRINKLVETIASKYPEFVAITITILVALYFGNLCYRKPHSLNNIRLRLSDLVNHLIPAGLKPNLSNLPEVTAKAIMACSRDQYAVRKSILNTSKCIIKPFRAKYKFVHELAQINITRTKDPEQPIVKGGDVYKTVDLIQKSKFKPYNKLLYSVKILILFLSGMRVSEYISLNLDDIDFSQNRIFIQTSKNGKSRWIGINHALKPVLENYITEVRPNTNSRKVFVLENGKPLTIDRVEKIFKQLRNLTGLKNLKPHSLRRLFCTHFAGKGVPLPHLQMALGHSSIAMVMRYCKPDQEEILRQQVNW
jgi:site-specific recombinase XerD